MLGPQLPEATDNESGHEDYDQDIVCSLSNGLQTASYREAVDILTYWALGLDISSYSAGRLDLFHLLRSSTPFPRVSRHRFSSDTHAEHIFVCRDWRRGHSPANTPSDTPPNASEGCSLRSPDSAYTRICRHRVSEAPAPAVSQTAGHWAVAEGHL